MKNPFSHGTLVLVFSVTLLAVAGLAVAGASKPQRPVAAEKDPAAAITQTVDQATQKAGATAKDVANTVKDAGEGAWTTMESAGEGALNATKTAGEKVIDTGKDAINSSSLTGTTAAAPVDVTASTTQDAAKATSVATPAGSVEAVHTGTDAAQPTGTPVSTRTPKQPN